MIKTVTPPTMGWLEKDLSDLEIEYLWNCIESKGKDIRFSLAGNLTGSYSIFDTDNWFFNNTLLPLCRLYAQTYENLGDKFVFNDRYIPYFLKSMWVNYQKQYEFNPHHNHSGVYSFVVWMKIPNTIQTFKESNTPCAGSFQFTYTNILGEICEHRYDLNSDSNGKMLFFPSKLTHQVYPFFNSEEIRISISGNIALNI